MERELGKVESVHLGFEDHGILTLYVHLKFGGTCQAFGGIALDTFDQQRDRRTGTAEGCDFILRLLKLFGVQEYRQIVGRYVYALRERPYGSIEGLVLPEADGGAGFLLSDWRADWGLKP